MIRRRRKAIEDLEDRYRDEVPQEERELSDNERFWLEKAEERAEESQGERWVWLNDV